MIFQKSCVIIKSVIVEKSFSSEIFCREKVNKMKEGLHPAYKDTVIVCACGAEYPTRSTRQNIHVDICSKCHPFYTGKQKFVDAGGRVDKFNKKFGR